MGCILILDSQSVRVGKGLVERESPQHVHVLGIQFLYDGIVDPYFSCASSLNAKTHFYW